MSTFSLRSPQPEKIAKSKTFTSMLEKLVNAGKLGSTSKPICEFCLRLGL